MINNNVAEYRQISSTNKELHNAEKEVCENSSRIHGSADQSVHVENFKALLNLPEYSFLRENSHLGDKIMLLGVAGSYGYGTNREGSDIDFRGVAMHNPSDILGLTDFEQYVDSETDTVVYGFNKVIKLLLECNPNCLEILGLPENNYMILSPQGEELRNHQSDFLSKRAIKAYGGYVSTVFRRLQNALARDSLSQGEREKSMLHSLQNALNDFNFRNLFEESGSARLYMDKLTTPEKESDIFIDVNYTHLPLRKYTGMLDTLHSVLHDYDKIGHRSKKDENHLNKHAMHLVRLLMTAIDVLDEHKVITARQDDLPLLLKIRNGEFMAKDGTLMPEFFEIYEYYQHHFQEAARRTTLPDQPDMEKIEKFVERINRLAIMKDY